MSHRNNHWDDGRAKSPTLVNSILRRPFSIRGPLILGLTAAFLFFGLGLGWAGLAPLVKGATAYGRLIVESKAKFLQHRRGGTVAKIYVGEGQEVRAGQLLVTMDTTRLSWALRSARDQVAAANRQKSLLEEEVEVFADLLARKLTQKSRVLALRRQLAQLDKEIARLQAQIGTVADEIKNAEITAPSDGRILRFAVHAAGEVLAPNGTIAEFVPRNERLVVEARLSPSDVDDVYAGMDASVWLTAFNRREVPALKARVAWVSPDSVTSRSGEPDHYRVRVTLQDPPNVPGGIDALRAGMHAEVLFVTGKQTLLSQLFEPLLRGLSRASRN